MIISVKETMRAVVLGTGAWAIVLVVEVVRGAHAEAIWICVVGLLFGLVGVLDIKRRLAKIAKSQASNKN